MPQDCIRRSIIHRADDEYSFLHDTMLAFFGDRLLCAWYNSSEDEIQGKTVIRGRWSDDLGQTWSEPELIAQAEPGSGLHMVPAIFSEENGKFFAYITEMTAHDLPVGYRTYRYEGGAWAQISRSDAPALFNAQPVRLADGRMLSAGRMSAQPGSLPLIPCVMSSEASAPAEWQIQPLPGPWLEGEYPLEYPETTLIVDKALLSDAAPAPGCRRVTAVTRSDCGLMQAFESADAGYTWSGPADLSLPVTPAKLCGGTLKCGMQYLIYNESPASPGRSRLVISVRKSNASPFRRAAVLFDGADETLGGGPNWHYPCAVERDGYLYVSCTSSHPDSIRRHAALAVLPVEMLTEE